MRDVYAEITGDSSYRNHPIENVSSEVFYGPGYEDCDRRVSDVSRAERLLGWKVEIWLWETSVRTTTAFHETYASGQVRGRASLNSDRHTRRLMKSPLSSGIGSIQVIS